MLHAMKSIHYSKKKAKQKKKVEVKNDFFKFFN